ncbi:TetR/AcrR family transcriptional regulator [Sphingomonas oryzagri]|uniref:TetR/AcrR family transcriptional regulator n=1 Tax=Sphingomonas oryzagri TaxID=3042314 RepID=A0ABT6MZ96_9SPHN|nr:TetR/AcrR family transcriptional regulator [Sphingomonas oryzagri]MDH7638385.1 TetR/AcrR family transcriptional regulator [Sphingomonas oryzagri]
MGRRSDHSRDELRRLIIEEGHRHMAEVGFARFSAREVAKRIGYTIGTLYNVFGSYDRMVLAINTRTFALWAEHLRRLLAETREDPIRTLVEAYFSFARDNRNAWMAIYDHRLPPDVPMPDEEAAQRGVLTEIVTREVAAVLPEVSAETVAGLARSLIATVHGHCLFALNGTFALMGEEHPLDMALARVRESIAAAQGTAAPTA